jgi:hypothetical protein
LSVAESHSESGSHVLNLTSGAARSCLTPRRAEGRGQRSEVRGQRAEGRGQRPRQNVDWGGAESTLRAATQSEFGAT